MPAARKPRLPRISRHLRRHLAKKSRESFGPGEPRPETGAGAGTRAPFAAERPELPAWLLAGGLLAAGALFGGLLATGPWARAPTVLPDARDHAGATPGGTEAPPGGFETVAIGRGSQPLAPQAPAGTETAAHHPPPSAAPCYLGVVLPHEAVDVVAESEGRLREILVRPGDRVAAGEVLARLHEPSLGHRLTVEQGTLALVLAEVRSFTVQMEQAERSHERRVGLGGLLSRQEIESSEASLELARYRLDVADAELVQAEARVADLEEQIARLDLRAPFAGTVGLRYLDRGATVRTGTPVVRLVGRSTPRVRFAVPPAEAAAMPLGLPVLLELEGLDLAVAGTLTQHPPEIDAASGLV
ncbi:MAG: efflux RND transporter periplasmic adaptor subunit, partial [Holophagales bacterium]|nr:efflux RND transporter periplasmic adaptor subunit [Holophagales bacterium]